MRRIFAQARKELIQILRDKRAVALALILPLTQLILMGSSISLDVKDMPLAVQDFDNSPASALIRGQVTDRRSKEARVEEAPTEDAVEREVEDRVGMPPH